MGLLFSTILMALTILRTALEDRTLKRGLAYAGYAGTVRYRPIPHVW